MIGDRHHDIEGARHHGIKSVFVAWGYGSPAEEAQDAVAVVNDFQELHGVLAAA